MFLYTTASRTALGPTQPPIQCGPGALPLGIKGPGREADHSPPSGAKVKGWVELYLHSSDSAQLKHRDNFTFTLPFIGVYYFSNSRVGEEGTNIHPISKPTSIGKIMHRICVNNHSNKLNPGLRKQSKREQRIC